MRRRHLLLTAAATLAPTAGRAAATTWTLPTGYKADSFQGQNVARFARMVEAGTGGSLRIEVQPDNQGVPLAQIAAAVRAGRVQAGEVIMTGLAQDIPIAGADAVPFVVASYEDAQRLWQHQRPLVERHFEARGLKPLFAVPWPPQGLYTIRPVRSADDLRGTRMRTYNATTVRIAQLLGAEPVDVPMSKVGQALAEGRIDTMITSAVTGVENKVWSAFKFFYEINAWFPKNLTFANAAAYAALSDAQRQAVLQSASAAETAGWAASRVAATESAQELRRNGLRTEPAPPLLQPVIRRLGERFSLEWLHSVGREANEVFVPFYAAR
ncbi:TRAP transporter substrate-binding protein [Piscinibacter gummiphilus]|uniref:TRAP transporter substrate-binding protein n=1 Tax=Piscinibacter gummiphilus TaxID=946333 RepID=A0ABZ0CV76_9BURK|nr:TRAP transporter substrate-binding protein [Piscinibacter gummiphilus]WOB08783.1 TRAP transporter substrate-binding protein [Piscinibacter gummiphilus]